MSPSGLGSAAAVDNGVQGRFLLVAQNLPLLPVPFVSGGISGMLVGLYRHMQLVTDGVYSHMYLYTACGNSLSRYFRPLTLGAKVTRLKQLCHPYRYMES
eukprot:COSAG03_NODE_970_length_5151_cov_637.110451_3_plen_100_part_00